MSLTRQTTEQEDPESGAYGVVRPGLLLVAVGDTPAFDAFPLGERGVVLGRSDLRRVQLDDERMSRRHAEVGYDGTRFRITDLASRNGTFLDGVRVVGEVYAPNPRVVRLGRTLFALVRDVGPYLQGGVSRIDSTIVGPALRAAWDRVQRAARLGDTLVLTGESGSGKELAARLFHREGRGSNGPFVAVNCATIPETIAERLLFGAQKGAYSGATADSEGYVQAAHGGTLFLDEIAELDLAVQAKLLRVLETREVIPLGSSRRRAVDLRIVCATHKNLRELVVARKFREDLYFRLGRAEVAIPPLRARVEEMPWLVHDALGAIAGEGHSVKAHPSFLEACALRHWPGNVRELRAEAERAAQEAVAAGRDVVEARDLAELAGRELLTETPAPSDAPRTLAKTDDDSIEEALRRANGNVTQAARDLGIHRNQLRRWIAKKGLDPSKLVDDPASSSSDP